MKYVDTPCGKAVMPESFEKEKGEGRFRRLKHTHPRQYDYCMGGGGYDLDGFWKPTKDGLGMAHCIEELNKIYGKEFIKL